MEISDEVERPIGRLVVERLRRPIKLRTCPNRRYGVLGHRDKLYAREGNNLDLD